jgi:hypothetical protein
VEEVEQGNEMVTACVVDENDLKAEYREKIMKESVEAEMVIVETEENKEQNQPPTLWQRYTIPIFLFVFIMIFILVMVLTFAGGNDDDTIQSLPTVTMSPSDQNQDVSGWDPVLPPTLQAIQDRGYIRCRASPSEQDKGFGFSIDLVRTTLSMHAIYASCHFLMFKSWLQPSVVHCQLRFSMEMPVGLNSLPFLFQNSGRQLTMERSMFRTRELPSTWCEIFWRYVGSLTVYLDAKVRCI